MLGLTGPSACSKSTAAERSFVTFMSDIRVIVETIKPRQYGRQGSETKRCLGGGGREAA